MTLRGVQATGSNTVTSTLLGTLREDARSRQEFFALTGIHKSTTEGAHLAASQDLRHAPLPTGRVRRSVIVVLPQVDRTGAAGNPS